MFSKLKVMLKKAANRKVDALRDEIGRVVETISANECRIYFRSAGYACN